MNELSRRMARAGVVAAISVAGLGVLAPLSHAAATGPDPGCYSIQGASPSADGCDTGPPGPEAFPGEFDCYKGAALGAVGGAASGSPAGALGGAASGCAGSYLK